MDKNKIIILLSSIFFILSLNKFSYADYGVPVTAGGWSRDSVNSVLSTESGYKVAIGQVTANTALDVVGTVTATAFSTTAGSLAVGSNTLTTSSLNINTSGLVGGNFFNSNLADGSSVFVHFGKSLTNCATLQYHKATDGASTSNYIGLYHQGVDGGIYVRGYDGNVGVNILSPSVKFEVREDNTGGVVMRVNVNNTGIAGTSFIQFTRASEIVVGSIDAVNDTTVAYNTFTGSHYTKIEEDANIKLYMVLESTGEKLMIHDQCVKTRLCRNEKSKNIIGVYGGKTASGHDMVLSIGTGLIWVTNTGEDVEIGDYLTSSNVAGYSVKQDDDILHNYTVAKTTQAIIWKRNEKTRLIACTYHGG